ncbi:DUF1080 domain-containing protein, partial [bacterium]|nr:DUF1080 domain-containing protein [bacterium]
RLTLVRALGQRRVAAAVPALLKDATAQDTTMRLVALGALANIGDPAATAALAKAADAKPGYERTKATSFYLLLAQRLAEAGKKPESAAICRGLIKTRPVPRERHVVSAALSVLAQAIGGDAVADLMAAADSPDKQLRAAALRLVRSVPGEAITAQLAQRLKQAAPAVRVEILGILGQRADRTALPAALDALKDADKSVRIAAIAAAARIGGKDVLSPLLARLDTDQADEAAIAQRAIATLEGDDVNAAVAKAVPNASLAARASLLGILASRQAKAHLDTVMKATADKDANVRTAAVKAIGVLAEPTVLPRLVELLLGAESSRERTTITRVLVGLAAKVPDANARAGAVLAALPKTQGAPRLVLLQTLSRLGGPKALAAVLADTRSPDAATQDGAIRALADWSDAAAAPELLKTVGASPKLTHQVIALRGYVRLVGDAAIPDGRKVQMLQDALAVAKRPQEKKLVLGGLGGLRTLASLQAVVPFLDDQALAEDAAATIVRIACPQDRRDRGLAGAPVVAALQKVIAVTKNPSVRKKAQDHLKGMPVPPPPDSANVAQGKPASSNVGCEGANAPARAVDGVVGNGSAGWWGRPGKNRWLQIDLQTPTKIDTVQTIWYWQDARLYRFTVEVSADGKKWTQVADMSKHNRPGTPAGFVLKFEPVEARYVRLSNIVNSVNPSCHLVELKIFAEGKGPKGPKGAPAPPKPDAEGFVSLFNGKDVSQWIGAVKGYVPQPDGSLCCLSGGNLMSAKMYSDFILRFDFKLTANANNGLGLRVPDGGHASYAGMELQILDNKGPAYTKLQPYQYHASIYGVQAAKRGFQKPVGEWNTQEVIANGSRITVKLNGTVIVDHDLAENIKSGKTPDGKGVKGHPGILRKDGRIGFLGHGAKLWFRNIRIKEIEPPLNTPPPGFTALSNGKDLTGWKGLVGNPKTRAKMTPEQLAAAQKKADDSMRQHWKVEDGAFVFDGKGQSLCTAKDYGDFEMYVDWKIKKNGDSGIYLRGSPQVQIWDPAQHPEGSGGLFNNQKNPRKPTACADNPIGEWSTFYIKMVGDRVTVKLNGKLVVDNVIMENFWERNKPIYPTGQIELQNHGNTLWFRNVYLRELPRPKRTPEKGQL